MASKAERKARRGTMTKPNIFDYATSELTQDAFICWLVSWIEHPENAPLHDCAKAFVAWLFNRRLREMDWISKEEVQGLLDDSPHRQHGQARIDIYFKAQISGKPTVFIIEDKTHTSPHSGQLERGLSQTENECRHDDFEPMIIPTYFKTGFINDQEKTDVKKARYQMVTGVDLYEFLRGHTEVTSEIFDSYIRHLKHSGQVLRDERYAGLMNCANSELFQYDEVQALYLHELQKVCSDTIGHPEPFKWDKNHGEPRFAYQPISMDQVYSISSSCNSTAHFVGEYVWYLIYRRKSPAAGVHRFCLAVKRWADTGDDAGALAEKKRRLDEYRIIFHETEQALVARTKLNFASPGNRSGKEEEIAILFFNESENAPAAVLKGMGLIHQSFVTRVKNEMFPGPQQQESE